MNFFFRKLSTKLDCKEMTASFMDFLDCKCCKDAISKKSKLFWAKKHVRAKILQRASQVHFNNDLLQELHDYHMVNGKIGGRRYVDKPHMYGFALCWKRCFPFVHGCEYSKILRFRRMVEDGIESWNHQSKGRVCFRKYKGSHVHTWLKALKTAIGEYQPTSKKKVELPPDTKANLYIHYLAEMEEAKNPKVCYRHFIRVWHDDFPELILPENCRLVCFISNILIILFCYR